MFRRTKVCSAVLVALGSTLTLGAAPAFGQQTLDRVEITGSSIKRIQTEGALPVQTITREDIQRSGVTTVADLLQQLPAAQGSVSQAASVGGETGGFVGISLRALGEQRTLVLLNGKRITQFGGQSITGFGAAVDLNTIPLAAIERVEILTDGASALYGSDAIAGVVNFITRRNASDGDVSVGFSSPSGGARETRISATKGIGDIDKDGFNVLLSASADKRTKLKSTQRDFANSALVKFADKGRMYQINSGSPSPIPANIVVPNGPGSADDEIVSPYFIENGVCPTDTFLFGARACYYDYVTQLEIYPEQKRNNLYLQGAVKLSNDHRLTTELLYSKSEQTSRIAPVPGSIPVDVADLPAAVQGLPGLPATGTVTARYRVFDLGPRTAINKSDLVHFTLGLDGSAFGWDYGTSVVHSVSKSKIYNKGYPEQNALFTDVLFAGLLDPFVGPGQQSQAGIDGLQSVLRNGYYNGGKSTLDVINAKASREIAQLEGGPLSFGAGANFGVEKNNNAPSGLAQGLNGEVRFGDEAAVIPYSGKRKFAGAFAELVAPVTKTVEGSAAVRFDKYQGIGDSTNGKVAIRWQPTNEVLVRGSIGTGFRAPTVKQTKSPEESFGVTSDQYDCSSNTDLQAVAASLGAVCRPDGDQYDVFAGGNKNLKPEKSKQASLGIRFEPTRSFSVGADFWVVGIEDAFGQVPESEFFANPTKYTAAFRTKRAATGENYIAIFQGNANLGNSWNSGIDFDVVGRVDTGLGGLTSQLTTTYMVRNTYQLLPGDAYFSSLGQFGADTTVTFRIQGKWSNTLKVSDQWSHTLAANFKSGYADSQQEAEELDANGVPTGNTAIISRRVRPQMTLDWQTVWTPTKQISLQLGILNLFDRNPPFSIATGGNNKGQMRGYDDRYYDPRGRTYYANASYKF